MLAELKGFLSFEPNKKNAITLLTIIFFVVIFFWRLGSLVPGLSSAEAANITASHSLRSLYAHPIGAPHNILIWLIFKLNHVSATYTRAVSAGFGLAFTVCFYKIARSWFGPMIGWLTTLLFATTPLVILAARSATTSVMYLDPLALLAIYFWLARRAAPSNLGLILLGLATLTCFYTPGGIYVLVIATIFGRAELSQLLEKYPRLLKWVLALGFLVALAPLSLASHHDHQVIRTLLLVPAHARDYGTWLSHVGWMALAIFWRSGTHGELQLSRLGILNLAQLLLAACGIYAFWSRARAKIYGLVAILALAIVGAGTTNNLAILLLSVAALLIFAGAGLRYLHIEWQSVFPRNPFPRVLAVILMSCAVIFSVFYGVKYSLLAWPHNVSTRNIYVLKYPEKVRE